MDNFVIPYSVLGQRLKNTNYDIRFEVINEITSLKYVSRGIWTIYEVKINQELKGTAVQIKFIAISVKDVGFTIEPWPKKLLSPNFFGGSFQCRYLTSAHQRVWWICKYGQFALSNYHTDWHCRLKLAGCELGHQHPKAM